MKDQLDKRIQRSKTALKETFLTILYQKPFDQITISEIVRKANYNRGTFYANFETKQRLLDEIIEDILTEMMEQIRIPYKSIRKVNMQEIDTNKITLFTYFKENENLFKLLLSDHIRVDFRYQMAKAIEQLFIEEYEYELEDGTDLSTKWLYTYRAHGVAAVIFRWIEEDFIESPEYMSEQIVKLMTTATEVFYVKKIH